MITVESLLLALPSALLAVLIIVTHRHLSKLQQELSGLARNTENINRALEQILLIEAAKPTSPTQPAASKAGEQHMQTTAVASMPPPPPSSQYTRPRPPRAPTIMLDAADPRVQQWYQHLRRFAEKALDKEKEGGGESRG
ncbi:MAG: hypothetical protein LRS46_01475 [Desulfurococcales archaeon]|nr:hypothetical protein [Desulfurococcales archaeon]